MENESYVRGSSKTRVMKTEVFTSDLKDCLKRMNLIAVKNSSNPIDSKIRGHVDGNGSTSFLVYNYNDKTEVYKEKIKSGGQTQWVFVVDCSKLSKIIQKAKSNTIILEKLVSGYLSIIAGNLKTKIPTIDESLFSENKYTIPEPSFIINFKEWKEIVERCKSSIGDNESRKSLMGLNITHAGNDKVVFTGADAYRIAEQKKTVNVINLTGFNGILSGTTLKKTVKLFDDDDITFSFDKDLEKLTMSSDDRVLTVDLIAAEYPNLSSLLCESGQPVYIESPELYDAMDMVQTIVSEGGKNMTGKITMIDNSFKIEVQKTEFSDGSVEIPMEGINENVIGINIHFFSDLAALFKKTERISINISSDQSPILIQSEEFEGFKAVLMPVRINW